ncbi:MAG: AAA family ATPase [Planctomycetota bacterium]
MSDELNFNAPNGSSVTQGNGDDESTQRREKLMSLLRGRLHWAIILSLLLGGGLGYLGYISVVPMYRSSGQVVVESNELIFEGVDNQTSKKRWYSFVARQEQMLRSQEVAERAMASDTWKSRGEEAVEWTPEQFAKAIDTEIDEKNNDKNIFTISFDAPDAITAGVGNRALLDAYSEEFDYRAETRFMNKVTQLQSQVQKSEIKIKQVLAQRRTVLTDYEFNQMGADIRALTNQRIELQENLDTVRAELNSRNPIQEGMSVTPADLISTDPVLNEMQIQVDEIEDMIKVLEFEGKGPGHREVKRLIAQRDVLNAKMEQRMKQLLSEDIDALIGDPEYDRLRQLEQLWHRQLADVQTRLEKLNAKQAEVADLQELIDDEQRIIDKSRDSINEINVEMDALKGTIDIFAPGATPSAPDNGGKANQIAVLGAMAGTGLGFGFVMLLGMVDSRLRHAGDARMGLRDTRMLGILPTLPENFADPEQSERAAHAVHHIRTLLQISNRGTARVFSVTSPAAGSGKSSLSVAMGLSFAASESKTLVIDCDLVGAGLTRRVGAVVNRSVEAILREDTVLTDDQIANAITHAREKGTNLKDALVELGMLTKKDLQRLNRRQADSALGILDACQGRPFNECVANTGIENFHVLPIGAAKPQDAGLLSPKAIRNLIARAREEYDIVLLDTGPCLGSLEASMCAAEADATVLIVSRGDSKSMASKARDHLVSVGANVVGCVFNHALDADMNSASFASIVSQERRTDPAQSLLSADPAIAARFGPLGSAVAAFGTPSKSPNGKPRRKPIANGSSNGH